MPSETSPTVTIRIGGVDAGGCWLEGWVVSEVDFGEVEVFVEAGLAVVVGCGFDDVVVVGCFVGQRFEECNEFGEAAGFGFEPACSVFEALFDVLGTPTPSPYPAVSGESCIRASGFTGLPVHGFGVG